MFGNNGVIGSSKNVPQWIVELIHEVEDKEEFYTEFIFFKESKSGYRGACYHSGLESIDLYMSREKTIENIWIVLHELTHAWQHLKAPETITKRKAGRRNRVVHNQIFFETASRFFKKYGGPAVLEHASMWEYKRGRKYMV